MNQNVYTDDRRTSQQSSHHFIEDLSQTISSNSLLISSHSINKNHSSLSVSKYENNSRIECLERNLRHIQEQQGIALVDLHDEIARLQQENRDLHDQLINISTLSSRDQKYKNSSQISTPPTSNRLSQDNQILLKQQIDRLEKQLLESEEKNKRLSHTIDELTKAPSSKSEASDMLIPIKDACQITIQMNNHEHQNESLTSFEKEQQYLHEITKLRSVLHEVLNTEQLNVSSKALIRECLTSTNMSENMINKNTTTPVDMLFNTESQQQESNASSFSTTKNSLTRPELPVRRLNLSPPQGASYRSTASHRVTEQRVSLPPVLSRNNTILFTGPFDSNGLWYNPSNAKNGLQRQPSMRAGETPIARRERATQELQKIRLSKNLYP